ncbi:fatty acid desaturase [Zavarzinella formosa]|uniref:fatty acid desaturase n=1 Tax=Zavarzinella formosa TaxID=360055 RepID=UPI0012FA0908|nr:fatty acid desaturase [Zavarzinella formosa]
MSDPMEDSPAPPMSAQWRNMFVLAIIYGYIAIIVLGALWFFRWRETELPWWTDIPVGFLAIFLIGPAQHRLFLLGQEACLGVLFRNRWLNELAGDWLTHFPFSTSTHHMRHIVRSHYEFPNDPERDAELIIAGKAGFWPLKPVRFLRMTALLRWHSLRANYNFSANPNNPYQEPGERPPKVALRIGTAYVLIMFAILIGLYLSPNWWVLVFLPPSMWVVTCFIFLLLPGRCFHQSRLKSVYSPRFRTLMQITFITLVNLGLGWSSYFTGRSGILNYIALWVAPMVTTCTWAMLLRQWRQHAGREQEAAKCTANISSNWLRRLLVFPLNQHLHQTKHDFPETPWYHLPRLAQNPTRIR